jgi:hypothetical protein
MAVNLGATSRSTESRVGGQFWQQVKEDNDLVSALLLWRC